MDASWRLNEKKSKPKRLRRLQGVKKGKIGMSSILCDNKMMPKFTEFIMGQTVCKIIYEMRLM